MRCMRASIRPTACLIALLCALFGSRATHGQGSRLPQDEIVYQIMPIAWRDSDNDKVGTVTTRFGDFGGLASTGSLDYLQYLGVTMIYLQPIFPSAAYHGYQHGPADTLNARFGTESQFLAFVNAAHARDMKVILDFVAYGISQNSTWYASAYNAPASPFDAWLAFTNPANTTYVGSQYNTWNGSQVGFIHWNLENPAAATLVTNWAKKWLDPNGDGNTSDGVDGFRLDHAWASGGEGWGANITFWETWCSALRTLKPDVFIFCEPSDWGNYGTDLLTPNAFDAVITKPLEFAIRGAVTGRSAAGLYSTVANTVAAIPAGKTVVAESNDHDSNRLASEFNSTNATTMNGRQKVAAAVLMTLPFPPNIYYGDEIGMKGSKASTGSDADDIPMREPFKWNAVAGAPMTNYAAIATGTRPPTYSADNDGRSVPEQRGVSGSILETYRSLIAVRKASVALRRGSYTAVPCTDAGVYAFVRSDAAQTVLVAINLGSGTVNATLDLSAFTVPQAGTTPASLENATALAAITAANKSAYPISLSARGWFIGTAALSLPQVVSHADIDGRNLPADAGDGASVATQSCVSSFADNAGELNQLFARADGDALRVSISGNLPQDGTSLDLFVDVDPGAGTGQNRLATAHLPSPPGGLAPLDGTIFDAGFAPDALYYINTVNSVVYVDRVSLPSAGTLAAKDYRGAGTLNAGRGVLLGGINPNGVEVALDNTNGAGISAGGVATADTATKGFEIRIPFADLGLSTDFTGSIALAVCIQRGDGAVSNQWLPGLPSGRADLGLAPNLTTISGMQHAIVSMGLLGDLDGSGGVDVGDIALVLLDFGPCSGCAADVDQSGTVDFGDVAFLLLLFS